MLRDIGKLEFVSNGKLEFVSNGKLKFVSNGKVEFVWIPISRIIVCFLVFGFYKRKTLYLVLILNLISILPCKSCKLVIYSSVN